MQKWNKKNTAKTLKMVKKLEQRREKNRSGDQKFKMVEHGKKSELPNFELRF